MVKLYVEIYILHHNNQIAPNIKFAPILQKGQFKYYNFLDAKQFLFLLLSIWQ